MDAIVSHALFDVTSDAYLVAARDYSTDNVAVHQAGSLGALVPTRASSRSSISLMARGKMSPRFFVDSLKRFHCSESTLIQIRFSMIHDTTRLYFSATFMLTTTTQYATLMVRVEEPA